MAELRFIKQYRDDYKPAYGWLTDFLDRSPEPLDLGELRLVSPAILNLASERYANKGVRWKVLPKDNNQFSIPINQTGTFLEVGYLYENQKPVAEWNAGDIDAFASRIANLENNVVTDSFDESYVGQTLRPDANSTLYYEVMKAICLKAKAKGNNYYGSYAGDLYLTQVEDSNRRNDFRQMLTDGNVALQKLRPNGGYNHSGTPSWDADYSANRKNLLNYKDVIINQYVGPGGVNGRITERLIESVLNIVIAKKALSALGNNTARILSFMWQNNCEVNPGGTGFSAEYNRAVPNGNVKSFYFPNYSPDFQKSLPTIALCLKTDVMCWNDPATFGTDPATMADSVTTFFQGNGAGPEKLPINDARLSGVGRKGFPYKPQGCFDLLLDGARAYEKLWKWVDNQNFTFCPIHKKGQNGFLPASPIQIIDAYQQGTAFALISSGSGATAKRHSIHAQVISEGEYEIQLPDSSVVELKDSTTPFLCAKTGYDICIDRN